MTRAVPGVVSVCPAVEATPGALVLGVMARGVTEGVESLCADVTTAGEIVLRPAAAELLTAVGVLVRGIPGVPNLDDVSTVGELVLSPAAVPGGVVSLCPETGTMPGELVLSPL